MARRKGSEAEQIAEKGLEARLDLLIRNAEFKQDLVNGREMCSQYKKALCRSVEKTQKRKEMNIELEPLKWKYAHYLAKWDLNWGPWEYTNTEGIDFPSLSPKELKTLFKQAFIERDQRVDEYERWGESSPPHMFRLPVIASDPVARERERVSMAPPDHDPEYGEEDEVSEEELDDLVHGQVGKKLNLELNLTFPRDVLEELVRLNLEEVFNRMKEPKKRQRLDKFDFQLRVFDLHKIRYYIPPDNDPV